MPRFYRSALRSIVDRELAARGTDFAGFIGDGLASGRTINQLATDLVRLTAVPVSYRTVYRWVDELDEEVVA